MKLLGVLCQSVFLTDVLAVAGSTLHVVDMVSIWVKDDFGRVVEKHTGSLVGEIVSKTILGGVVDPFLDPDLSFSGLDDLFGSIWGTTSLELSIGSAPGIICGGGESSASSNLLGVSEVGSGWTTTSLTWHNELSDVSR